MCVCREVPSGKASWRRWYLGKKYSSEAKPGSLGINQYVLSEQSDVQSSELGEGKGEGRSKADHKHRGLPVGGSAHDHAWGTGRAAREWSHRLCGKGLMHPYISLSFFR